MFNILDHLLGNYTVSYYKNSSELLVLKCSLKKKAYVTCDTVDSLFSQEFTVICQKWNPNVINTKQNTTNIWRDLRYL